MLVKMTKRKTKKYQMAMIMKKKDQQEVVEVAEAPGARKWSTDVKASPAHQLKLMMKHMQSRVAPKLSTTKRRIKLHPKLIRKKRRQMESMMTKMVPIMEMRDMEKKAIKTTNKNKETRKSF